MNGMTRNGKRTVLVALVGMSPAVLTETVWALAAEEGAVPDEIVVLTTTIGAAGLEAALYGENGIWDRFAEDLAKAFPEAAGVAKLKGMRITPELLRDAFGGDASDMRTPEDGLAAADRMVRLLRGIMTPRNRVLVSIAGGRKAMGALLFSCMSLLGRRDDRVLHVLVDAPYDSPALKPHFHYPSATEHRLPNDAAKVYPGTAARVTLFDVPFVRMRNFYQGKLEERGYAELVGEVDGLSRFERIDLVPDAEVPLRVDGRETRLNAAEVLALWLIWKDAAGAEGYGLAMAELKRRTSKRRPDARPVWLRRGFEAGEGRFCTVDDPKTLEQDWSKTVSALRKRLGEALDDELALALLPKRGARPARETARRIHCTAPKHPALREILKDYGGD